MGDRARSWVRRVTAALMILTVCGVVGLAIQRSKRLRPQVVDVAPGQLVEGSLPRGDEAVGVYHGFEFTESVAGKTIFVLHAEQTLGLSSGWHEITGVRLQLYREGRPDTEVTCDRARFNVQTRAARLFGAVQLHLAGGGLIDTERGRFNSTTRRFTADSPVVLSSPEMVGEAKHVVYDLSRDEIALEDGVVVRENTGRTIHADKVVYSRQALEADFPLGFRLEDSTLSVRSARGHLWMDPIDGRPGRIQLDGGVDFALAGQGGGDGIVGWAQQLNGQRDRGETWHLTAVTDGRWVRFTSFSAEGMIRTLSTWRLVAVVGPSGILNATSETVSCLMEVSEQGGARSARAEHSRFWFDRGRLTSLLLEGSVELVGEGARATGSRARFLGGEGKMVLSSGERGQERVALVSGKSRMSADRVTFVDRTQEAEAEGAVSGSVQEAGLMGPGDAGEIPVRFAAGRLHVTENGDRLDLKDNARVWQGRRLLLADEVVFHQGSENLEAFGNVRTTLPSPDVDGTADTSDEALIVARSFDYQRTARVAEYKGNVRYSGTGRILSAAKLTIVFDKDDSMTSLDAEGQVNILDLTQDRKMSGSQGHYDAASKEFTLTGNPVHLVDQKGNVVTGASLTWNQASGTVSISGGEESPSETVYHPEEQL